MSGLDGPCSVIGAGDYIEIWSNEAWVRKNEELQGQFADVAENLAGGSE
jgi:DNA-binding transcriptional regulator/RsmH inhibitor MraZ